MRTGLLQRMAAILILIAIIYWFYNKQLQTFRGNGPLVTSAETTGKSTYPKVDKLFCESVLNMDMIASGKDYMVFERGLTLFASLDSSQQVITMRTRRLDDLWDQILASPATIVAPPAPGKRGRTAAFTLPGGQTIELIEYP